MTARRRVLAAALAALGALAPRPSRAADLSGLLEQAAKFDPTIHFGKVGALTIQPLLQTRWTLTERSQSPPNDRDTVVGFSVPRARLIVTAQLWDAFTFRVRIGTSSNGDARFEQAYANAKWKDFQLRAGQFYLLLNAGDEPSPQDLSTVDFSSYANTFAGGQTQGMQLSYGGPVRLIGTVGNGARSGFSELLSPIVADVAATGRVEVPIGAAHVEGFGSEPGFRKGQKPTARLGAHGHFQTKGSSSSSTGFDFGLVGGDVAVHGSGFSFLGSVSYLQLAVHDDVTPPVEDLGFMLFGSVFPARRVELFAQFDAIWPIGAKTPHPSGFASGQPGTTPFRTLTVGSSFFIVPDVNRLKLQLDMATMFDGQTTSIVPTSTSNGVLATPGAQVAGRVQLVVAL